MKEVNLILDDMKFSYSRLNSFYNCKYMWLLQYINELDKEDGYFGEYGSFCHLILEKYFKGELEIYELLDYYISHYWEFVVHNPPPYPKNLGEKYYESGYNYFANFEGLDENLETIEVENKMEYTTSKGNKFGGIKDLLVQDKNDGEYILIDHKSSNPYKNHKPDKTKIKEYLRQLYIYCADVFNKYNKYPKELRLNFFRIGEWYIHPFNTNEYNEAISWIDKTIDDIKEEKEFLPKSSLYFCKYLCSMRLNCEFIPSN